MGAAKDLDPAKMTKKQQEQFVESYAKIFNQNRPKAAYKFPETLDEQRSKCDEADALRVRGNALYKAGNILEAAKLYEQAVLKFADWYADCFATDEERALVLAVKIPSHLNLAACSQRLGNHQHTVTHCTSVLEHEKRNENGINAKAYFRRGTSQLELGNLTEAREDLKRALELSPTDAEVRKAVQRLQSRTHQYKQTQMEMTRRMLSSLPGAAPAPDLGAPPMGNGGSPAVDSDQALPAAGKPNAPPMVADLDDGTFPGGVETLAVDTLAAEELCDQHHFPGRRRPAPLAASQFRHIWPPVVGLLAIALGIAKTAGLW